MNTKTDRLIRFGAAGAISTLCYLIFATALFWIMPNHGVLSSIIAYGVCIGISYILQRNFTFRAHGTFNFEFPRFAIASLLGLVLSTLIVRLGIGLGFSALTCYVIVALIVAPLSYVLLAQFVFITQRKKT